MVCFPTPGFACLKFLFWGKAGFKPTRMHSSTMRIARFSGHGGVCASGYGEGVSASGSRRGCLPLGLGAHTARQILPRQTPPPRPDTTLLPATTVAVIK